MKRFFYLVYLTFIVTISGLAGCTTILDSEVTEGDKNLVVYGYIDNSAPPYTVEVSRTQLYRHKLNAVIEVGNAEVVLHEQGGASEVLVETSRGVYQSCEGTIQGQPGNTYWISVYVPETGESYTSRKEVMPYPVEINALWAEPAEQPAMTEGGTSYMVEGYNIHMDFDDNADSLDYYMIKYKGTYAVETYPKDNVIGTGGTSSMPAPLPCSGYTYDPDDGMRQVGECTCCNCWIVESFEDPILLDDALINGSSVNGMVVSFVPAGSSAPRIGRDYWIGAELRRMTPEAYDYWYTLLQQKNGTGTIFQPIPGSLPSNIISDDTGAAGLGYFYAAATDIKGYAPSNEKFRMTSPMVHPDFSCLRYDNSTNVKPDYYPF